MTDRIGAKTTHAAQPAPKAAPGKPVADAGPAIDNDSFVSSAPTQAQLAGLKAKIAALDALPPEPSGVDAKRKWVGEVKPAYEIARKAAQALESASFFHKTPPEAEADALGRKVGKLGAAIRDAEEATGLVEPTAPENPFRPLYGATKSVQGWMGANAFTAVVGLIAWPVAAVYDTADMVTRPVQALMWPARKVQHMVRESRVEEQQKAGK